ncbi:hypothetical protein AB6A40_005431 [Gnathostoma spinigerum]|uniref:Uncharacterized protein n=1 Tax=Gnathostoma spinigerum TaxID=75299 RepID=A0ABD6EPW1_9BILA
MPERLQARMRPSQQATIIVAPRRVEVTLSGLATANAPYDGLVILLRGGMVARAGLSGTMSGRKISCRRVEY